MNQSASQNSEHDAIIAGMLDQVALPPVVLVRQQFDTTSLPDIRQPMTEGLNRVLPPDLKGRRIAITCGSRGIAVYAELVRTLVSLLRERGALPFLIPAMGSHGGASAAGQVSLLEHLGITEQAMDAPVISSMETKPLGITGSGLTVCADRHACQADGIIQLNRIKPHTSFRGRYESGLVKMLVVGLGKQAGAAAIHQRRFEQMGTNLAEAGALALARLPILAGVAVLENGAGSLAELHVLHPHEILEREPVLLERAWHLMPRLYLDEIDVLIIGEIGKEISGTGLDTNIAGRFHTTAASGGPRTIKLGLLDLSPGARGNANGMGLADFITRRLADKIDWTATYVNTLTTTEPASSRMPMVLADDRQVFRACAKLCGETDPARIRLVVIRNTKSLSEVYMSPAAAALASRTGLAAPSGGYEPLVFDRQGQAVLPAFS